MVFSVQNTISLSQVEWSPIFTLKLGKNKWIHRVLKHSILWEKARRVKAQVTQTSALETKTKQWFSQIRNKRFETKFFKLHVGNLLSLFTWSALKCHLVELLEIHVWFEACSYEIKDLDALRSNLEIKTDPNNLIRNSHVPQKIIWQCPLVPH